MSGNRIDVLELIEKTKNGDKKSELRLYHYYKETLDKFLKKKYPKNYDHDDDVSEIALKIFEKISSYNNDKSKFTTWVINIANNYMIDKNRKKKPIYEYQTNSGTMTVSGHPDDPPLIYNMFNQTLSIPESKRPDIELENYDSITYYSCMGDSSTMTMIGMKSVGYNYDEIGCEFNLSSVQVSNKINYFQNKMKKKGV